jgi:glycosyltransferase involved in cell wall biosynthesis
MKVSIVLCTFNGEMFLEEQLISIAQQTRIPDEIIIVDDNSSDMSVEIVKRISAKYNINIQLYINESQLGISDNFSRAIKKATNDIIFLCDQDDVWLHDKIERMVSPFQKDKMISLVFSDGYIVGPNLKKSGYTLYNRKNHILNKVNSTMVMETLKNGSTIGIKGCTIAFRSWIRDVAGPVPHGVMHDSWIVFFGCAFGIIEAINRPLIYYRRHNSTFGGSGTNSLIKGLNKRKSRKTLSDKIVIQSTFINQVYERICYLENQPLNKKVIRMKISRIQNICEKSLRTLQAREQILSHPKIITRAVKALVCLAKGDYVAVKDNKAKLQILIIDITGKRQSLGSYIKTAKKICSKLLILNRQLSDNH